MFGRIDSMLALLLLLAPLAAPASATPTPLHAYEFDGSFADSGPGAVEITPAGGNIADGLFEFDPIHPGDIYEGLTLNNPHLTNQGVYTVELRLKLDRLRNETLPGTYGQDQGWIKVLDFTGNTFSQGLYIEDDVLWGGPGLAGKVEFIASGGREDGYDYVGVSPKSAVKANTWMHIALTRDAAGWTVCYLDGVKMFEFDDVWDDAVIDSPDNALNFMQPDDYALTFWPYPVIEVTQGDLDYFRIYDQALSETDVIALFQPVFQGDYNGDGVVNLADYTVWRDNLGGPGPLANDLIGGTVGIAQYETWKAHFGTPNSGSLANTAIPEPSAALLVLLGFGFVVSIRSRVA